MKLLLADDHNLFRDALVEYINRAEPDSIIMLARDLHEAMEILQDKPDLDLVLLDLNMPGMNGLQGLDKLHKAHPDIPVALLSGVAEEYEVENALTKGAVGYFPKTLSGKALLQGIKQIMEGSSYIARDHNTGKIMPSYPDGGFRREKPPVTIRPGASANDDFKLTPREKEVLDFLLRGESNKEIARALDLQVVTVKLHVRGICRNLGARNRTQAALIAREKGL